jgi:hypothetical protein
MRLLFSILFFTLLSTGNYAQGTAGLTIPANQTFVLGEYRTTSYRASVKNIGSQHVEVVLINRNTRVEAQRIQLEAGTRQSLKVPAEQILHLVNAGSIAAKLKVNSPVSGTEGMSYLNAEQTPDKVRKTKIELPTKPSTVVEGTELIETSVAKATLEPGQSIIIGEGSAGDFNVRLTNMGSGIEVSGRTKNEGRQTQGFGLGKFGKVDMYLRPNEVLYLVNNSDRRSTVKAKMDRPVRGVRIIER